MTTLELTNEEIVKAFESKGLYICIIDDKDDKRDNGMIYTVNKWDSINLFPSYKRAYSHFLKNNWI